MLFTTVTDRDKYETEVLKGKRADQDKIDSLRSRFSHNFKLRLTKSCVDVNDWETVDLILNGIYEGKMDLTLSRPLLESIFNALSWMIEPLDKPQHLADSVLPNRP